MPNTYPNKCSYSVIIDYRAQNETIEELERMGFKVIPTLKVPALYDAINGHADIQVFKTKSGLIVAPEVFEYYKNTLSDVNIIKGSNKLQNVYPYDISYNCANLGNYLICKRLHTTIEILEYGLRYKKEILNVNQGYSKCSVCIINENAIITADKSIAKVCKEHKIDVLEIDEGYIELNGMNYGFIGGATGLIDKSTLAVNGEIKTHPNSDSIISFAKNHGVDIIELKKGNLYDVGSIFTV